MYPNFMKLKDIGIESLNKGDFEHALECFESALELGLEAPIIHVNIATALLHLGRYPEAYEQASKAVESPEFQEESLFLLGKAAYGMQKWHQAVEHFEDLSTKFPKNRDAVYELLNIKAKMDEDRPEPDFTQIWDQIYMERKPISQFSDYYGPIEIVEVHGKGHGLRVTRDVKAGTLLLAEQAYALGVAPEKEDYQIFCTMTTSALQKAKQYPESVKYLMALSVGNEAEETKTLEDRMLFIMQRNVFGMAENMSPYDAYGNSAKLGCLCIMASFMNHSCIPNISQVYYGDIMAVYALKDLKKGDEILKNYVNPEHLYKTRNDQLKGNWEFECDCHLCELDKADGPEKQMIRRECLEQQQGLRKLSTTDPRAAVLAISDIIDKLKETYVNRSHPIHMLSFLYDLSVARLNVKGEKQDAAFYDEIIKLQTDIIEICERDVPYMLNPQNYLNLAGLYKDLGNMGMTRAYIDCAYKLHKTFFGLHGMNRFKTIYPSEAYVD